MNLKNLINLKTFSKYKDLIFPILIVGWGIFLRLYKINQLPFGLYPDIAANGIDILEILQGKIFPFYYRNGGREGLFFYFSTLFVAVIGNKSLALYLASSFLGIVTLPVMYLFGKTFFNKNIGLMSTFLLASSFYHINFSRLGYRVITLPLFLMLALIFLKQAFIKRTNLSWILAGVFLSLGFYTYISYRIIPFLLIFLYLIFRKKVSQFKLKTVEKRYFLLGAFLVLIPFIIYTLRYPGDVFGRILGASVFSGYNETNGFPSTLTEKIIATLKMFFIQGDPLIQYNVAFAPLLNIIEGILLMVGFYVILKNICKPHYLLIFLLFFSMLVPVIFSDSVPHILRGLGIVVPLYIVLALGLEQCYLFLKSKTNTTIGTLLVIVILLSSGIYGYQMYFQKWANQEGLAKEFYVDLSAMSNYTLTHQSKTPVYFVLGSIWNQKEDTKNDIYQTFSFLPKPLVQWGIKTWDPKRPLEPKIDDENAYFWEGNTIKYLVYSEYPSYEVRDYRELHPDENGYYIFSKLWHPDFREKLLTVFPQAVKIEDSEYFEVWDSQN